MGVRWEVRWTPAMIDVLTNYWNSGMVAAEIAALLAREFRIGFTKNAVLGKAHRLGLPARPSPIRSKQSRPATVAQPASARAPYVPKIARPRAMATSLNSPRPSKAPPAKVEPRDGLGILSEAMKSGQCQWPLWGEELPPLDQRRHCGCDNAPGRPYCAGHAAIAYVKPKPLPGSAIFLPGAAVKVAA